MPRENNLFTPTVPDEELHPDFKMLMESEEYAPARGLIREVFNSFVDKDGHFIKEFQTKFHPRIWELYLHSYLVDSGFAIDLSHKRPDFIATKSGITVCIEAVTANPTQGSSPFEVSEEEFEDDDSYILYLTQNIIPIKLGGPLFDKLKKQYWELPHVKGSPLILAIEDFHDTDSHFFNSYSLQSYLYGVGKENPLAKTIKIEKHEHGSKKIPSGFFWLKDTEYISAVIFNNSGDVEKFNRMGQQGDYRVNKIKMIREGVYIERSSNSMKSSIFSYEVGDSSVSLETWGQGMEILHNPNASHPVSFDIFCDIVQHRFEKGQIEIKLPSFHPLSSLTHTSVMK